jgi:hypothetical protein
MDDSILSLIIIFFVIEMGLWGDRLDYMGETRW